MDHGKGEMVEGEKGKIGEEANWKSEGVTG